MRAKGCISATSSIVLLHTLVCLLCSAFKFNIFQMRSGYGRSIYEPLLPVILGRDISGEVAAVGNSVRSLTVGHEVFGALHPTAVRGTYTDYAILAEDELTLKPESISHVVRIVACSLLWNTQLLTIAFFFYVSFINNRKIREICANPDGGQLHSI